MIDAVTVGETMALVRTQSPGRPGNHAPCTLGFGGSESNVAIGMSRLGSSVRWISALGQDSLGDMILATLRDEGVDAKAQRPPNLPTGLMVKTPSRGQERFVNYYRSGSAASAMSSDSVSSEDFRDARLMHLTGITPALSESCRELSGWLAREAKTRGLTLSFDVNFRPVLWGGRDPRPVFREIASSADIVFGDHEELNLLLDQQIEDVGELVAGIRELGPREVVVKMGSEGATALSDGHLVSQGAVTVSVEDTVGAGDAFVAGYLSALLEDEPVSERLLWGVICGAQACTDAGDWEGSPSREALLAIRRELAS